MAEGGNAQSQWDDPNQPQIPREYPELLRLIVQHAPPIAVVDREMSIVHSSRSFADLTSPEQGGRSFGLLLLSGDCHTRLDAAVEAALAGQASVVDRLFILTPSGTAVEFQAHVAPLADRSGKACAALLLSDKPDAARLRERTRHLADYALLGHILPITTHDLNNHLAAIIGLTQMMMSENVPDAVRFSLQQLLDTVTQCRTLIGTSLSAVTARAQTTEIDVNQLITNAMAAAAADLHAGHVHLQLCLAPSLPCVRGNPCQIEQALLNMINHARHAMPCGGTLTIESREASNAHQASTALSDDPPGRCVEVRFADTRREIPPAMVPRVFEPFFNIHAPHVLSIGLPGITRTILKGSGGTITLETTAPEGTSFLIHLPVRPPEPAPALPKRPQMKAAERRVKTVLVVEDDDACRLFLAQALAKEGYDVDTAHDGRDALARIGKTTYDAMIADLRMPHMNGQELYEEVRKSHPRLAASTLFVTGDSLSAATQEFLRQVPNRCLVKPFSLEELLEAMAGM